MRECWINVYPRLCYGHHAAVLGAECSSSVEADEAAIGFPNVPADPALLKRALRFAGVGYRLHVRLKTEAVIGEHVRALLGAC